MPTTEFYFFIMDYFDGCFAEHENSNPLIELSQRPKLVDAIRHDLQRQAFCESLRIFQQTFESKHFVTILESVIKAEFNCFLSVYYGVTFLTDDTDDYKGWYSCERAPPLLYYRVKAMLLSPASGNSKTVAAALKKRSFESFLSFASGKVKFNPFYYTKVLLNLEKVLMTHFCIRKKAIQMLKEKTRAEAFRLINKDIEYARKLRIVDKKDEFFTDYKSENKNKEIN